jgi:hypothetical protein
MKEERLPYVRRGDSITLSMPAGEKEQIIDFWQQAALECGFPGRYGGNISALFAAMAALPEEDKILLVSLLKKLLTS